MKDRKCAPHTRRHATNETQGTWLVSFLENLRRIEHWVLVRAADCPSAIQLARIKLKEQLTNPLGSLDFKQCVRASGDDAAINPFRPSSYLDLDERPGSPRPLHLTNEGRAGVNTGGTPSAQARPDPVKLSATDEHDSFRSVSMPTVH